MADGAVIAALRRAAPALPNAAIIRRMAVDDQLDLVVALASRQPQSARMGGRYWWSLQDRLGLFLQARSDPARVDRLALEAGPNDDCATRIERITAQELVLSCIGEKWATYDNRKFVYDIRAKAMVSYFSYPPYWTAQVLRDAGGPHFVMANNQQLLLVDVDRAYGRASCGACRRKPAACWRKSRWRNRPLETEPCIHPLLHPIPSAASDPAVGSGCPRRRTNTAPNIR